MLVVVGGGGGCGGGDDGGKVWTHLNATDLPIILHNVKWHHVPKVAVLVDTL